MLCCPQCGSRLLYKDGLRYLADGSSIQRYLCRNCGYRFSETRKSNIALHTKSESDAHQKAAKLLVEAEKAIEKREAGATEACFDVKGKILEFAWLLKKQGYSEETIRLHVSALRTLHKRGADLYNPESVKEVITRQKWSETRRRNVINAYSRFLKHEGIQWDKPRCKVSQKLPFIPTEQELDALIAGSGSKTSVLMQLLKETAMRAGEAMKLKWTDIDFERRIVTLNEPEKGSKPRMWKVSEKLIGMLKSLPRENEKVFGKSRYDTLKQTLQKTRKRLAVKLQNPRLAKITFHTFRHWKATMLYHKTKDPYYVKDFLGHKSIKNTEIYITVERAIFGDSCNDEFTVKVASNPEEIKALLEVGFEYVCEKDGLLFFRKRK
jgi:integrase